MEFRIMGAVELWIDGRRRGLGSTKERCVLAALLLTPRQPVSAESLIRRVWDDDPPAKPRQSLHSYIARLRGRLKDLDGVAVRSGRGSYSIDVEDEAVDLHLFRMLREQARSLAGSGENGVALTLYRRATKLWRAPPLEDLPGDWMAATRRSLEEELLAATYERIDMELYSGHHANLVSELSDLAERHPYDEGPAERLMVALFRSGRPADALEVYRRTHARIAHDVGTDVGPGLKDLQQRILRNDPLLLRVPGARLLTERPPNNLPYDVHAFTGRHAELRHLEEVLSAVSAAGRSPGGAGSAVTVVTIDGMPGVGKSALAVHLAHRAVDYFPDGQLFLDLRAHKPGHEPLDPATALEILLRQMGIPATRIPRTLDERAALWRSELAAARVLLVLDDAVGHDQVRPLLPASASCLVLVTSRRRLVGLHGSDPMSLETLPAEEAATLFNGIIGSRGGGADADVAAVVEQCGRLPLAVQIAASRLRHRRAWSIADLLARLSVDDWRLEELRAEGSEITVVFEMSYRGLSPAQQRAFRALGLHPGPDFTAYAAAAAIHSTVREVERILADLLDHNLIIEALPGRYRFHDLLHEYARRLAFTCDSEDERRRTVGRVLDYYISAADRADAVLYPHRLRIDVEITYPALERPSLNTPRQAQEWFSSEHQSMLGVAHHAARHDWPGQAARLAYLVGGYLEARGYWDAAARLHESAIAACRSAGDRTGLAHVLSELSLVRERVGEYSAALAYAEEALLIYRAEGERRGEADILDQMSFIYSYQSRFSDALACSKRAIDIRRSIGDQRGEASSLDHAAIFLEYLGRYRDAHTRRNSALAIFTELGDQRGRAMALNNMGDLTLRLGLVDVALGYYKDAAAATSGLGRQHEAIWLSNMANIDQHRGRNEEALIGFRKALAIMREIGDRRSEAEIMLGIGTSYLRMGRSDQALAHYQKGLVVSREIREKYEETLALRLIGEALLSAGRHPAARAHFHDAYDLACRIGVPYEQAKALEGMGSVLLRMQGREQARKYWKRALRIFKRIGVASETQVIESYLMDTGSDAVTP